MPAHDEHDTRVFRKAPLSGPPLAGFPSTPGRVGRALRRRAWPREPCGGHLGQLGRLIDSPSRDGGLRRSTRYLTGDPSPTRRSACSHPASQPHREAPRAPRTCSWTPIPTNTRYRANDPSSIIGPDAVGPAVGGDQGAGSSCPSERPRPRTRPAGMPHVHPGTPAYWQAGNGGAGEASPCGRSRGHAASSAGGTHVRDAGGDRATRRDADLAELAGGLAMRDASAARGAAERERIAAIAALTRDQTRIDGLTAQLDRASVIALRREQASATALASWQLRAREAERRLARARRVPPPSPVIEARPHDEHRMTSRHDPVHVSLSRRQRAAGRP